MLVHKPAGMLVHRGMFAPKTERFLLQEVRDQVGMHVYPIHRLDRPTSGLVMFGLSSEVANTMQKAWQAGKVSKTYHAIVRGWMPEQSGFVDMALDDPDSGILQEARTEWNVLAQCSYPLAVSKFPEMRLSLMELHPLTGRYHQLRRHFSRLHHPIIGDTTHGDRHHNHALQEHFGWWRLMLWARCIRFPHPITGEPMVFEDDSSRGLGEYWQKLLDLRA